MVPASSLSGRLSLVRLKLKARPRQLASRRSTGGETRRRRWPKLLKLFASTSRTWNALNVLCDLFLSRVCCADRCCALLAYRYLIIMYLTPFLELAVVVFFDAWTCRARTCLVYAFERVSQNFAAEGAASATEACGMEQTFPFKRPLGQPFEGEGSCVRPALFNSTRVSWSSLVCSQSSGLSGSGTTRRRLQMIFRSA